MNTAVGSKPQWLDPLAVVNDENHVDAERLEAALDTVRSRVKRPEQGLFGPDSMMWRVFGDQAASMGALRAVLLQTAHPFIAHAVQQKSAYRTDPQGRGRRTIRAVNHWIFGDLDMALAAARRVWRVHERITGEIANDVGPYRDGDRYAANEWHALLWVHATTLEGPLHVYQSVYGPLSRRERERYHDECRLFALLFGLDEELHPPTFEDFDEYMAHMFASEVITPDQASRDIAKYLLTPNAVKVLTSGLLPERVRTGYRFRWGPLERSAFAAAITAVRLAAPRLPAELRGTRPFRRSMHDARDTTPGLAERGLDHVIGMAIATRMPRTAARGADR